MTRAPGIDFAGAVRQRIAADVVPLVAEAEAQRRFPREAVHALGRASVFRERWAGGGHGAILRSVTLAEELGRAGTGGVGVGISLHLEAVLATLVRHAGTPLLERYRDAALDGELVGCVGATERASGSDMAAASTVATPCADGLRIQGSKWFVSPADAADFCLVLCRAPGEARGLTPRLTLVLVPRDQYEVDQRLETVGMRGLATCRISMDTVVSEDAVVGRRGAGLAVITWGLLHERLAIASQVLGVAALAHELAITRLQRRTQFGSPLLEHQALKHRMARLLAELQVCREGVRGIAGRLAENSSPVRAAAAAKLVASGLAERVVGEAMHVYGGLGYVEDRSPMARLNRDIKVGRLGAGSDEVMLELVAGDLRGNDAEYDRLVDDDA